MTNTDGAYKVLARKYRPRTFSELVGQDALVRIIGNSIQSGRVAHAFILSGVRGVGKTTTARLIAKSLNCVGVDGQGTSTMEPCDSCAHCMSIAKSNSMDVLEMDAASRTGVNDVREIIETVKFQPSSARYKIYIIDEVHMLSNSAFNALLKTLEEPPEHVKFVFATTEIRSVPVTILSRCQRFDLRRVEPELLARHLRHIAELEKVKIEDGAINLIVRASEGSVRDAISLLDQAISFSSSTITAAYTREMLGLTDRGRTLDLIELILKGDFPGALQELQNQYYMGADPQAIVTDLADTVHWLTVAKISPETLDDPSFSADERKRGKALADTLNYPILVRYWQMLLKVLEELTYSPNAMTAAKMAIVRLTSVSSLPTPIELVEKLTGQSDPNEEVQRVKPVVPGPVKTQKKSLQPKTEGPEDAPSEKPLETSEKKVSSKTLRSKKSEPDTQPQKTRTPSKKKKSEPEAKKQARSDIEDNELVKSVTEAFPNSRLFQ